MGSGIENAYTARQLNDITGAIFGLDSTWAIRDAYDQMAGLVHTTIPAVTFSYFNQYMNIQKTRMLGFISGGPSFMLAAKPMMLSVRTNMGSDANNTLLAAASRGAVSQAPSSPLSWGLWMQGYGSLGERRASDISSKYDYNTAGIVLGFDKKRTPSFLLGGTLGYSYTKLDMKDLNEDSKIDSYQASVYGIFKQNAFYVSGIAAYGYNRYDTNRGIAFADISRSTSTNYNGHLLSGYLEGGYKLITKYVDIIPMAFLQHSYLNRDGFSEDDAGNIGLDVGSEHYQSFIGSLGVRMKKSYAVCMGGTITPELRIRWDHEFFDDDYTVNARFLGSSASAFTATSDAFDRDRLAAGVGINWQIKNNVSLNLSYDGYFSGDTTQHAGMVGFRYAF